MSLPRAQKTYEIGDVVVNGTGEIIGAGTSDHWLPGERRIVTAIERKDITSPMAPVIRTNRVTRAHEQNI